MPVGVDLHDHLRDIATDCRDRKRPVAVRLAVIAGGSRINAQHRHRDLLSRSLVSVAATVGKDEESENREPTDLFLHELPPLLKPAISFAATPLRRKRR